MTRQDYSSQFRRITVALKNLNQGTLVLDAEIVGVDDLVADVRVTSISLPGWQNHPQGRREVVMLVCYCANYELVAASRLSICGFAVLVPIIGG
jgi:hypothetical protein